MQLGIFAKTFARPTVERPCRQPPTPASPRCNSTSRCSACPPSRRPRPRRGHRSHPGSRRPHRRGTGRDLRHLQHCPPRPGGPQGRRGAIPRPVRNSQRPGHPGDHPVQRKPRTQDMWRYHPDNSTAAGLVRLPRQPDGPGRCRRRRTVSRWPSNPSTPTSWPPPRSPAGCSTRSARPPWASCSTPPTCIDPDLATPESMRSVITRAVTLLGPDIVLAHAKELTAGRRPVPAGAGMLPWDLIIDALDGAGFDGTLVIHGLAETGRPAAPCARCEDAMHASRTHEHDPAARRSPASVQEDRAAGTRPGTALHLPARHGRRYRAAARLSRRRRPRAGWSLSMRAGPRRAATTTKPASADFDTFADDVLAAADHFQLTGSSSAASPSARAPRSTSRFATPSGYPRSCSAAPPGWTAPRTRGTGTSTRPSPTCSSPATPPAPHSGNSPARPSTSRCSQPHPPRRNRCATRSRGPARPPTAPYSGASPPTVPPPLPPRWAGITIPVLVIGHRDDPFHPYAIAEAYAQAIPRAELVTVPSKDADGTRFTREIRAGINDFLRKHAASHDQHGT